MSLPRQQSCQRLKTATCSVVQDESHLTTRWNLEGSSNQHTVYWYMRSLRRNGE